MNLVCGAELRTRTDVYPGSPSKLRNDALSPEGVTAAQDGIMKARCPHRAVWSGRPAQGPDAIPVLAAACPWCAQHVAYDASPAECPPPDIAGEPCVAGSELVDHPAFGTVWPGGRRGLTAAVVMARDNRRRVRSLASDQHAVTNDPPATRGARGISPGLMAWISRGDRTLTEGRVSRCSFGTRLSGRTVRCACPPEGLSPRTGKWPVEVLRLVEPGGADL